MAAAIVMGAAATMADVIGSPDLAFLAPVARSVGGPAVRNMATVAGNLFAEPPYGDFATALLAVGASVSLAGRTQAPLAIDDFLRDRARHRGRIVQSVTVERLNRSERVPLAQGEPRSSRKVSP